MKLSQRGKVATAIGALFLLVVLLVPLNTLLPFDVTGYDSPDVFWVRGTNGSNVMVSQPNGVTTMSWDGGATECNIEFTVSQPQYEGKTEVRKDANGRSYRDYTFLTSFAVRAFSNTGWDEFFDFIDGSGVFAVDYKGKGMFLAMEVIEFKKSNDANVVRPSIVGEEVMFHADTATGHENTSTFYVERMQNKSEVMVAYRLTVRYYDVVDSHKGIDFSEVWDELKENWGQEGFLRGTIKFASQLATILKVGIALIVGLLFALVALKVIGVFQALKLPSARRVKEQISPKKKEKGSASGGDVNEYTHARHK